MRFFAFVQKHCGPFLVLGYCYLAALILLSERLGWPDWAQMLLVLPLNAVAWPLAVLVWKDARTPRLVWRAVFALALVSILPVLLFLAGV